MKGKNLANGELTADVRLLKRSLNNVLHGLEMSKSDPALRVAYQQLLEFLSSDSNQELVFGKLTLIKQTSRVPSTFPTDKEIAKFNTADLEKILSDEEVSKTFLSHIAEIRFSVTRGALSKLSREALCLKLRNLIENEKTHETISRVARSNPEFGGLVTPGKPNNRS